jgi:hypothetical protein
MLQALLSLVALQVVKALVVKRLSVPNASRGLANWFSSHVNVLQEAIRSCPAYSESLNLRAKFSRAWAHASPPAGRFKPVVYTGNLLSPTDNMKTQAWQPKFAVPNEAAEPASRGISTSSYFILAGGRPIGPIPLTMALMKAVEIGYLGGEFVIDGQPGETLLRVVNRNATGDDEVVQCYCEMMKVAETLYEGLFKKVQADLANETQQT